MPKPREPSGTELATNLAGMHAPAEAVAIADRIEDDVVAAREASEQALNEVRAARADARTDLTLLRGVIDVVAGRIAENRSLFTEAIDRLAIKMDQDRAAHSAALSSAVDRLTAKLEEAIAAMKRPP